MNQATRSIARPRHAIPGENPEIARLSEMVIALLGEIAVLTERLDTVERLLDDGAVVRREMIEAFAPNAAAQAERDTARRRLIANVLRPLREAAERQATIPEEPAQPGDPA